MKYEEIEKVLLKQDNANPVVQIRFKTRNPIKGIFLKTSDYKELSRKNLWRIVSETHIDEFRKTGNDGLGKIFNGTEFTRLEVLPN